jgi:chromosome segregation ATPase
MSNNITDGMTDEQRKRYKDLAENYTMYELAAVIVGLESDIEDLKESERAKAEMNNKLLEENKDLKWQVENLEDEKKPIEKENQQYRERIADYVSTIESLSGDATYCQRALTDKRRENEELLGELKRYRRMLKNIRRNIKEILEA